MSELREERNEKREVSTETRPHSSLLTPHSSHVIQTRGLTRYFGSKAAVLALDLAVPRGAIFAFLGPNGSGKTTTVRMLLGLLQPTRGSATVLGLDSTRLTPELRGRIGYLSESHFVYGWMRVREAGKFQAAFYPGWREDIFQAVIGRFRLDPKAQVKHLSRGERAGLCLALTLAPDPELLIMDDPALGLDALMRRALLESMLYVTRREGRTVLFTTHILADVERVADRVAIINHGRLRACCAIDSLRERVRQVVLQFKAEPPALANIPGLLRTVRKEREIALTIANFDQETESLLHKLPAERISVMPTTLEEAFFGYADDLAVGFFPEQSGGAE